VEDKPLELPLYTFPVFALLAAGVSAVALGIGRAAIDELVSFASAKTPQGAVKPLAARQDTQGAIAEAEAKLRSARGWLFDVLSQAWEEANAKGQMSLEHRRDIRNAASFGTRTAAEVVATAYHLGGGTSVYRRSPLQRHFRDVNVATQHMMVGRPIMEQAGRLYLGLETDISTF
jgi:alkylation response protein AidB-like acyl-CoA dehydrogenase